MPQFEAIGVVVNDLARAAAFYRALGLEFPEPLDPEGHGHVEASLPGGMRFMLDTEQTVRSFDPEWSPPPGGGHRIALAFRCDSPAEVDAAYARLIEVRRDGPQGAVGCRLGPAVRRGQGSRRQRR